VIVIVLVWVRLFLFFYFPPGFFIGMPRPPFDDLIQRLVSLSLNGNPEKRPVIVSVDIPSGWHVEEGDVYGGGIKPDMLVSILFRSFVDWDSCLNLRTY
jgi:hypothetical protein